MDRRWSCGDGVSDLAMSLLYATGRNYGSYPYTEFVRLDGIQRG